MSARISLTDRAREAAKLHGMKQSKSHSYVRQQARLEILTELELANDNKGFEQIGNAANRVVKDARDKMNVARLERKARVRRWVVTNIFVASLLVAGWAANELWRVL